MVKPAAQTKVTKKPAAQTKVTKKPAAQTKEPAVQTKEVKAKAKEPDCDDDTDLDEVQQDSMELPTQSTNLKRKMIFDDFDIPPSPLFGM